MSDNLFEESACNEITFGVLKLIGKSLGHPHRNDIRQFIEKAK
jgi:hypothetical protein